MYRFYERKLTLSEVVPYIRKVIKGNFNNGVESVPGNNHHHSRSESRSASVSVNELHNINITFLFEEKLSTSNKRRYENQVFDFIYAYFLIFAIVVK